MTAPRPHFRRETCCEAECDPPASGRALAFRYGFQRDREAAEGKVGCSAVAFFSGRAYEDLDLDCGDLQGPPSTLQSMAK